VEEEACHEEPPSKLYSEALVAEMLSVLPAPGQSDAGLAETLPNVGRG
jgi:hypothetical protein